jgi:hypothetical protein
MRLRPGPFCASHACAVWRSQAEIRLDFARYKNIWKKEVFGNSTEQLDRLIDDWNGLIEAYALRNEFIHGKRGSTGLNYATNKVDQVLTKCFSYADCFVWH